MSDPKDDSYKSLFQAGAKLVKGRVNLDGHELPRPGFFERRRLVKALRFFERAAEVEPPYGAASLFAAKIEDRLGHSQENLRWLRKAQVVAPDNVIVSLELGGALSKLGLQVEAVSILSAAAQLNPTDARVHSNLGVALLLSGATEASIATFKQLVALEPDLKKNAGLLNLAIEVLAGRKPRPMTEADIARSI